ncbi:hypothetical protein CARUB_v10018337mg [Capsella rubella]|uniref:Uncharacterized protein n=1 Tax=Capsella rubella TaxID=81985 RepID=R0FRY2_9BRAS|nr:hypothetical protein CARUB_v10018337mg [Capsella rubella]
MMDEFDALVARYGTRWWWAQLSSIWFSLEKALRVRSHVGNRVLVRIRLLWLNNWSHRRRSKVILLQMPKFLDGSRCCR